MFDIHRHGRAGSVIIACEQIQSSIKYQYQIPMNQKEYIHLKQKLHTACAASLERRLSDVKAALAEAQESVNQESKSSAGDKHETGRAMMQLETEKLSRQLQEILNEQQALKMISPESRNTLVDNGALVITNLLNLYIAISAGKLEVDGKTYYAISINTPLGLALKGKKTGDQIVFQNKTHLILQTS
jgi:transcription elongation GreA/GreB family factor